MRHRVAVSGLGVVSPIGNTLESFRRNLFSGVSGIDTITLFDPASLPSRIGAQVEIDWEPPPLRDRKILFALEAARQAWAHATNGGSTEPLQDTRAEAAVHLGIGLELFSMDDLMALEGPGFSLPEAPAERLQFLQTPADLGLHLISHRLGLGGPPQAHVSACAAGTDAIGHAFRQVAAGQRRWLLAGGSDSMINPLGLAGFCRLGATSTTNDRPQEASCPFDRRRNGFVLGEGAAFLVLERWEDAERRGATIHAEVCGYGSSFDAHAISEPHPEGRGALQAMSRALEDGGIDPAEVDCVNAHGTSTPKNDIVETAALKRLLGDRAYRVPICATKSMIGHLIAAAGAVEAVAAIVGMEAGVAHPTINLVDPDPRCDLDYVPRQARRHEQRVVLSNSFAFGGQNAAVVFRHPSAA